MSIVVQCMLAGIITYGVASISLGKFSGTVLRCATGVGLITHMFSMYLKRFKMENLQQQIEPLYTKQIQAYERFLTDDFHNK